MLPNIRYSIYLGAFLHLVRNKYHRHLAIESIDRLRKMLGSLLIQIGNRLVEDKHLGAFEQGASNRDALSPPA
ncbi:hypothetical protein [Rhodocyclus tenuis]|uniref:Uncharacterized protein n=1 Tax=Rhodocyclus tenuis TaxID=1066 RepID=A0A840G9I3_RHOTE|nr:hypothetical protein [Rhodocyclus tenuis]MBB4248496.1 hypothetical protein [Rhodocyclus tenuis]